MNSLNHQSYDDICSCFSHLNYNGNSVVPEKFKLTNQCINSLSVATSTKELFNQLIPNALTKCRGLLKERLENERRNEDEDVKPTIYQQCVNSEDALLFNNLPGINVGLILGFTVSFGIDSISNKLQHKLLKEGFTNAVQISRISNMALNALILTASLLIANNTKDNIPATFFAASSVAATITGLLTLKVVVPEKTEIIRAVGLIGSLMFVEPALFIAKGLGYPTSTCWQHLKI